MPFCVLPTLTLNVNYCESAHMAPDGAAQLSQFCYSSTASDLQRCHSRCVHTQSNSVIGGGRVVRQLYSKGASAV